MVVNMLPFKVVGREIRRVGCVTVNISHFKVYLYVWYLILLIALLEAGISVETLHLHVISCA